MGSNFPHKHIVETNPKMQPILQDLITDSEGAICCKACGTTITNENEAVSKAGNHTHMQCNPIGVTFIFSCYRAAPGCAIAGEPNPEHSWFKGYSWQLAFCKSCSSHLGWHFTMIGSDSFLGLINERLKWQPSKSASL